jgi:pyruvate kinase
MNTPGIVLEMPALTAKDLTYLDALHRFQIEFVALSFVRSSHDVTHLRAELEKRGLHAAIIAKIENQAAIDNLDSIIEVSDGIMVARGDLGVELPFEEVPFWQKEIVRKCRSVRKPVITATQMLLSMVNNPRPSRAEVNDVANAVYDGSDAVMLSEESAQGNWPIKAVETQAKIVRFYEQKRVAAVSQSLEEVAAPVQKLQNFLRTSSKPIDAVAIYGASTKQMTQLAELRLPFPLVFIQPELTHVALNLHYGIYHCNAESPHAAAEQIVQQRILTSGQNLLILIIGNWANQSQQSLSILTV